MLQPWQLRSAERKEIMANTFKNAKFINASNSSASTVYTAGSGVTTVILGVILANKNAAERKVTVTWTDASDSDNSTTMLNEVSIPGDSSLEVLAGQKYIFETGDVLKCLASAASSIDVTVGLMEQT
jgi:hypothetical protein